MSGMGGGWFDAMGGGWFDAMGGGWMDSPGGGGGHGFAMRADRPLAEHPLQKINIGQAFPAFHPRYWDGDLLALTYLPKFFTFTDGNGKTWDQALVVADPPPVVRSGLGGDSIDEMLTMAVTERPEAMGEILNQHQNQQLCFLQLLMINHNSHPATYFAMKLMARVGEVVMMHFKRIYKRARPSQVCPTLYPPVAVPGHASYPAGHAVIATLTAACLKDITEGPENAKSLSSYEEALDLLAETIGRNRVIAGLHYLSDIAAGAQLGNDTYAFLKQIEVYKDAIEAAKLEWAGPQVP
jgi:acid phosphatase (class A)